MVNAPGGVKGAPSIMTPDTLSGWTTATWNAGRAPKSSLLEKPAPTIPPSATTKFIKCKLKIRKLVYGKISH